VFESLARVTREEGASSWRRDLHLEGDAARWLYLMRSGHVKIVRHSRAGKDVVLELPGPGG
jgi:CRP-like cAMP-binding protein